MLFCKLGLVAAVLKGVSALFVCLLLQLNVTNCFVCQVVCFSCACVLPGWRYGRLASRLFDIVLTGRRATTVP